MRVTQVTYTRVRSDHSYGNHQATVMAQVDDGEDPAEVLAKAKELALKAVGDSRGSEESQPSWGYVQAGIPADAGYVGDDDEEEDVGEDENPDDEDFDDDDPLGLPAEVEASACLAAKGAAEESAPPGRMEVP